jgi:hypothetical protein
MRFEILAAVNVMMVMMACSLVHWYQHFEETYFLGSSFTYQRTNFNPVISSGIELVTFWLVT